MSDLSSCLTLPTTVTFTHKIQKSESQKFLKTQKIFREIVKYDEKSFVEGIWAILLFTASNAFCSSFQTDVRNANCGCRWVFSIRINLFLKTLWQEYSLPGTYTIEKILTWYIFNYRFESVLQYLSFAQKMEQMRIIMSILNPNSYRTR